MTRRIVRAYSLKDDSYHEYDVPSQIEALVHSKLTWGKEFDRFERKVVEGGLPIIILRKGDEVGL